MSVTRTESSLGGLYENEQSMLLERGNTMEMIEKSKRMNILVNDQVRNIIGDVIHVEVTINFIQHSTGDHTAEYVNDALEIKN